MAGGSGDFVEIERKFDVDASFRVPDLAVLPMVASVTSPETFRLAATYYDTPDLRLAAARITLRRRTGGPDAGWHLKLPAGSERREVHEPLGAGAPAAGGPAAGRAEAGEPVPPRLAALADSAARGEPLTAIARLATTRTVRHLVDGSGRVLAEVADDQVTGARPAAAIPAETRPPAAPAVAAAPTAPATITARTAPTAQGAPTAPTAPGAPTAPTAPAVAAEGGGGALAGRVPPSTERWRRVAAWREVEVELRAGPPELLVAAAELLLRSGARRAGHGSKLARLLDSG